MRNGLIFLGMMLISGCGQRTEPEAIALGGQGVTPSTQNQIEPKLGEATPGAKSGLQSASGTPTSPPQATPGSVVQPSLPKSNLPISKAVPASVRVSKTPNSTMSESGRPQQKQITTSEKSDGSCGWKVESSSNEWAKSNMDIEFLKKHAVEAILEVTQDDVRAWKVDGSPHPDFEGFIRLKLQSNEGISFPMRYKKKTRIVVLKIPQQQVMQAGKAILHVNVNFHDSASSNMYELSSGDLGGNDYRFQYIPVSAPKEAKFASIPFSISVSSATSPIAIKAGQKFTSGGQPFEIIAVRPFQKSDAMLPYGGYGGAMEQGKFFATVVVKSNSNAKVNLNGQLVNSTSYAYDPTIRISIDDKGNIVREKVDPNAVWRNMMVIPSLRSMGGDLAKGESFLVANVNQKFLTSVVFSSSATLEANLENIPLER